MNKDFLLFLNKKGDYFRHLLNKEVNNLWKRRVLEKLTKVSDIESVGAYVKSALGRPSSDFLNMPGKSLRPILGHLMIKAYGVNPSKFKSFLILPELLHNSSLIVDDIEDNAYFRRNKPALHIKYGVDIAINTACALYYFPFHITKKSSLSREEKEKTYEILIESMNRIHIGQGLDILWHKNPSLLVTPGQYIQMVKLKTSSFFRAEAQLATLFSKAKPNIEKRGIIFAENLGVAFQIMDDILDLTLRRKEVKKFGKTFAQDITEGKKTLIVIYALEKANSENRKRLMQILSLHTSKKRILKEAIGILEKYKAIRKAREFVCTLVEKAWDDFSKLVKASWAKDYLRSYCEFIIERKF